MAVVSRIAKLTQQDTATGGGVDFRTWLATAATQDTAAGGSVDVVIDMTTAGATAISTPDTLTLNFYDDAGGLIRAAGLNPTAATQTITFYFTDTGTAAGVARVGTVEIALRATKTSGLASSQYDVETDGSPNTPASTKSSVLDRGWVRSTTTLVQAISNIALGGGKTVPVEQNESLFVRLTLGAISYIARTLAVAVSNTTPSLTGTTNSTTSVTRDVTFANVVDARFPAAVTSVGITVTIPNSSLTGLPFTTVTTTVDTTNVDPRLTNALHFQVDDNVWGLAKNRTSKAMLTTESGFLWAKITKARGTLASGVVLNQTLTPIAPGTAVGPTSFTSDVNGVAGPLNWTSSKPGGNWNWVIAVTTPTGYTSGTYFIAPTDTLVMLAPNPNYRVLVGGGPYEGLLPNSDKDHWHPGDPLLLGAALFDVGTGMLLTPDASPAPSVYLGRFNQAFGRAEYYGVDNAWHTMGGGATAYKWPLAASAGDPQTFITVLAAVNTSAWSWADIFLVGLMYVNGTPYSGPANIPVLAVAHPHTAYAFDPIGLFK